MSTGNRTRGGDEGGRDEQGGAGLDGGANVRDFSRTDRIVVKIGTNILTARASWEGGLPETSFNGKPIKEGQIDLAFLERMAGQISGLREQGKQIILVTSGAIGMGALELGLPRKVTAVELRQACAAIGQPLLMQEYRSAFKNFGLTVAQLLITRDVLNNRTSYKNLRNSVEKLLSLGVIPIFNENDAVSTDEIGNAFGDNDQLSAFISSKTDAELLILLSDIDAFYDSDPRSNPNAKPLPFVPALSDEIYAQAGGNGSEFSTGGMKTKLRAVEIARDAGCPVIIAHGRRPDILPRLLAGEIEGTLFAPSATLPNRMRWLKNAIPSGEVVIDDGALKAIRSHRSLLPRGITAVRGTFPAGSVVSVNGVAHMLCPFSSSDLAKIQGRHSDEIRGILGPNARELIARPEDIVFLSSTYGEA